MNKREFLHSVGGGALATMLTDRRWARLANMETSLQARDPDFWSALRAQYQLTPDYINLESGYYSMQAQPVLEAFVRHARDVNVQASHYMRTVQFDDKAAIASRLASIAGVGADELIITRNTTDSLDTVIAGHDWKPGDEAVMAEQDYGAMLDMFKLQARRFGMVNRVISLPLHPSSDEEIVDLYRSALSPRTRLLMVCHMVNITGQILPVAKIADMAHEHGVRVMIDGAHSFAQLDFKIPDLHGDFFGASLHKWLGAPLGTGLLYVKREHIASLWPMFADLSKSDNDITRLNHTGTHPVHNDLTIANAMDFHLAIGPARKEARLRYLQRYWTDKVRDQPRIILNTPAEPERSCAIANVGVEGIKPAELANMLMTRYRIWTVAIDGAGVHGVRITPQLFTTTDELDVLVKGLREIASA